MKPITYVAVGDSTGQGIGAKHGGYPDHLFRRIVAERPGSTFTNLCRSGARSDELLAEQLDRALRALPNLMTVCIGINDIVQGVGVDTFADNFAEILRRISNANDVRLVIANMPDIAQSPAATREMGLALQPVIAAYNTAIAQAAAEHDGKVVDIWTATHESLRQHPEFFSADGFHPSDVGYENWAETMWSTVKAAIED